MRTKAFLFAAGCVPLFAACSFLLDFKGLQGGHPVASDAGSDVSDGDIGAGGESGASNGEGGEPGAAGSCDAAACDDSGP